MGQRPRQRLVPSRLLCRLLDPRDLDPHVGQVQEPVDCEFSIAAREDR